MSTSHPRTSRRATGGRARAKAPAHRPLPGQVVLVFQGGGALGAYQVGVYEAMHERGIEPAWVIGTSIGAINAAIIAGNRLEHRLARLHAFWDGIKKSSPLSSFLRLWPGMSGYFGNVETLVRGIPGFFCPNPVSWAGVHVPLGVDGAAYYSTAQLRATLASLVDFQWVRSGPTRLTVGAVNVRTGAMRYFDSREEVLAADHVMASGALPPAFPAIRIGGEPYWDGGIYSNTPIEAVLDDRPRRDSVIFSVNVWRPQGDEPDTIWRVMGRQKNIQYASRADSHIDKQKQLHRLRHVIRELGKQLPPGRRESAEVKELMAWGCGTTMHVVRLLAPGLDGEDHTKDIDFTAEGIRSRWMAGYSDTLRAIDQRPWEGHEEAIEGVIVHEPRSAPLR